MTDVLTHPGVFTPSTAATGTVAITDDELREQMITALLIADGHVLTDLGEVDQAGYERAADALVVMVQARTAALLSEAVAVRELLAECAGEVDRARGTARRDAAQGYPQGVVENDARAVTWRIIHTRLHDLIHNPRPRPRHAAAQTPGPPGEDDLTTTNLRPHQG